MSGPEIAADFPSLPEMEKLKASLQDVSVAMLRIWALQTEENQVVTRTQVAELFGVPEGHPVLEMLGLFDHWSNDIMCLTPYLGLAYEPPEWDWASEKGSYIVKPARLFIPPPKPEGDRWYWDLDAAKWVEAPPEVMGVEESADGGE